MSFDNDTSRSRLFDAIPKSLLVPAGIFCALMIGGMLFAIFTAQVPAGYNGYLNTLGKIDISKRYTPGLLFKWPGVQTLVLYPTKLNSEEHASQPRDSTNQILDAKWSVQIRVKPEDAGMILQKIGSFDAFLQRIIYPYIQTAAQSETPTYKPENMVKQRPQLVKNIKTRLQTMIDEQLAEYGLPEGAVTVIQIACTDFKFSSAFNASIEKKVVQEQERQTAAINKDIEVIQADANGQEKETLASAEAHAVQVKADATTYAIEVKGKAAKLNSQLALFVQLERWDGNAERISLPNGGNQSFLLNTAAPAVVPVPATQK